MGLPGDDCLRLLKVIRGRRPERLLLSSPAVRLTARLGPAIVEANEALSVLLVATPLQATTTCTEPLAEAAGGQPRVKASNPASQVGGHCPQQRDARVGVLRQHVGFAHSVRSSQEMNLKDKTPVALIAVLLVIGCKEAPHQPDTEAPVVAHTAETEIEHHVIHVDMVRAHPFLAEYEKVLSISKDGKVIDSRSFQDTGGFASFYFLRDGCNKIAIMDGAAGGVILDPQTGKVSDAVRERLPRKFLTLSFGRFMFDQKRVYRWLPNDALDVEAAKDLPCF